MAQLKQVDQALEFALPDAKGKIVKLSDFKKKKVILYFYPRDNTPGCTIEAIDFSALRPEFEKAGAVVLGVSKDSCESHQKFIDKKGLTILLLSDPDAKVQKEYGVWKPLKFMGREYLGTQRTTFLIDSKGLIQKIWEKVSVKGHAEQVLNAAKEL